MKIKKIGHCCLVIEFDGVKIMTDPGSFSTEQIEEQNIDYILITHEHGDHIHIPSLKQVMENNPMAKIITNSAVKNLLDAENIFAEILEDGQMENGADLYAETCDHADIFDGITPVKNTGYLIGSRLFYPGDAWLVPKREVEILALPVAGPWSKIRDCLEYAIKVNPKSAFPVHDGMLKENGKGMYGLIGKILGEQGTNFTNLNNGESLEF